MAKAIFLKPIRKSAKKTRLLIYYNNDYHSVLLPTEECKDLEAGEKISFEENIDETEFKAYWIPKYTSCLIAKLRNHLAKYKKHTLGIEAQGYWEKEDGTQMYYAHILPDSEMLCNLINSVYYDNMKQTVKNLELRKVLHRGFKNLLSSQAFAFNLFCPIVAEKKFLDLLSVAEPASSNITENAKAEFEHIEDNSFEKSAERKTQFDFFLEDNGNKHFFEVKYSEDAFGNCKVDDEHQNKYSTIYKDSLAKIFRDEIISVDEFCAEYQLWRNICHVVYGDVYFVFPRFRKDLADTVNSAKERLKDEYKNRVHIMYADDVVKKMIDSENEKLKAHYEEFCRKYLDIEGLN